MTHPTPTLALALALVALPCSALGQAPGGTTPIAGSPFEPPGLLVTQQRITDVLAALPSHPALAASHQRLLAEARGHLSRTPNPIQGALKIPGFYTPQRAVMQQITRRVRGDASAAHCLALAHAFGAGPDHARKAKELLFAWVDALTHPEDGPFELLNPRGDTPIVISYAFPNFCYAYDLLRARRWITPAEERRFSTWLRRFVDYMRVPDPFLNNHHSWRVLFLMVGAHVLEDAALFDRSVRLYRDHLGHQIAPDGSMPLELVRGKKAATYTVMALEAMIQTVVIAERHGHQGLRSLIARPAAAPSSAVVSAPSPVTLKAAVDRLQDFIDDPDSWRGYRLLTGPGPLNGPAAPSDWGWLFELPAVWWGDPSYGRLLAGPYGLHPPRAYTLSYAALLFRPIPGVSTPGQP